MIDLFLVNGLWGLLDSWLFGWDNVGWDPVCALRRRLFELGGRVRGVDLSKGFVKWAVLERLRAENTGPARRHWARSSSDLAPHIRSRRPNPPPAVGSFSVAVCVSEIGGSVLAGPSLHRGKDFHLLEEEKGEDGARPAHPPPPAAEARPFVKPFPLLCSSLRRWFPAQGTWLRPLRARVLLFSASFSREEEAGRGGHEGAGEEWEADQCAGIGSIVHMCLLLVIF